VPSCYLLAVCSGSSLDQQSNNVTLFNMVEQLNLRPGVEPPRGLIPLEIHAYFELTPEEVGFEFEIRFCMVADTGLETVSDPGRHKPTAARYRTRTIGLPLPPVIGQYHLRIDWRAAGSERWHREPIAWPLLIAETPVRPRVTH
jgi:hypothetical protein